MKASIIVPTYNRKDLIKKTVSSIEALDFDPSAFELIVVDDGSDDGTKEYFEDYRRRTGLSFSYVWQKNKGPAAARNAGLRLAKGEFIAFTDSDCIVDRNWLNMLVSGFTSPNIAVVGGSVRGVGEDIFSQYFEYAGIYNTRIVGENVIYVLTLNACYRRNVILELDGFSERFRKPGGEDPELCIRIKKKHYAIQYSSAAVVYHHHKSTFKSFLRTFHNYGEGLAILVKSHPEWYSWKNIIYSFLPVNSFKFYLAGKKNGLVFSKCLIYTVFNYLQNFCLYTAFLRTKYWTGRPAGQAGSL